MNGLMNVGFGNYVNTSKILCVVRCDSAPIKRMVQNCKDLGTAIDATQGRKTKSVILLSDNKIVLSALLPDTLSLRMNGTDVRNSIISENPID